MLYIYSFGRHFVQIDLQTDKGCKHRVEQFERVLLKVLKVSSGTCGGIFFCLDSPPLLLALGVN